jgi:hypothetical protein
LSWTAARDAAALRSYNGLDGHLVTISSADENAFVVTNCPAAITGNWWIGGYQDKTVAVTEPSGGWRWVGEGAISYLNWQTGEPNNNAGYTPPEDYLQILSNGKWNDNTGVAKLGGYVVEYETLPLPGLSIGDAIIGEGNAGTKSLTFTVTLDRICANTVTVHYETQDGTAVVLADYLAAAGEISFDPGQTSKTISVSVLGDTAYEPDESFKVLLSSPSNAAISRAEAMGTILNDDLSTVSTGKIVFTSDRDGDSEIYLMNADGSNQQRLTNNSVSDSYPALSPDGTKVAFTSYRNNNLDIYIMNAAPESVDNPAVRLTSASGYNYNARFDHAGDKIVFVTSRYTSTTEVCVMGIDGSNQTRVTNNTFGESNPSFSPDDAKIVYDSYRNNKTLVYAINADGTGETKLSPDTTTGDSEPIYSPDATTIAFTSSSSIFFHAAGRQ